MNTTPQDGGKLGGLYSQAHHHEARGRSRPPWKGVGGGNKWSIERYMAIKKQNQQRAKKRGKSRRRIVIDVYLPWGFINMAESLHEICKDLSECTCRERPGRPERKCVRPFPCVVSRCDSSGSIRVPWALIVIGPVPFSALAWSGGMALDGHSSFS